MEKKKKNSITAFSILFIILIIIFIVSQFLQGAQFAPIEGPDGEIISQVSSASLPDLVMSPYNGFVDAIDISIFVLVLGGFLGIVDQTGVLNAGISKLVKGNKGREKVLIVILMVLFSIGGTTYGMAEETVAFYGIVTAAMVTAGFDSLVAVATICLGAGVGVLGSTVNPFSTGAAIDAISSVGLTANQGIILPLGAILWLSSLLIAVIIVLKYADKVQKDKGSTLLSLQEQEDMKSFKVLDTSDANFTGRHKLVLGIFAFTFFIMIISLIPWVDLGVTIFDGRTGFLTGQDLGDWYFAEIAMWYLIMGVILAIVAGLGEKEIVDSFVRGAADILSVVLIIVVSRAISVLMQSTYIDALILDRASKALAGMNPILFTVGSYILFIFLSILIPSTSGLASVAMPVMGGLAAAIGLSPEVMVLIFASAAGLVNLFTPTSGVVMGGLEMAKVNYSTWLDFVKLPLLLIGLVSIIVLSVAMVLVS